MDSGPRLPRLRGGGAAAHPAAAGGGADRFWTLAQLQGALALEELQSRLSRECADRDRLLREIDLALQVSIPLLDVVAEDADLMVRFGPGHYADVEHIELARDVVTPLASPAFVREHGPFERPEDLEGLPLLRSPLEPWRTWFAAHGLDWPEPVDGSSFNDIGLMCDAAAQGLGIGLVRLKLGAPWIENGSLERIWPHAIPSPHAHYLCWRTGALDRWECAAFAEWLKKSVA